MLLSFLFILPRFLQNKAFKKKKLLQAIAFLNLFANFEFIQKRNNEHVGHSIRNFLVSSRIKPFKNWLHRWHRLVLKSHLQL